MKTKFNTVISIVLISIVSFFCLINEVSALKATTIKPGTKAEKWQNCWHKTNQTLGESYIVSSGNRKKCKTGENYDFVKWVAGNASSYAYCADRTKGFSSKATLSKDKKFSNAKNCQYYANSTGTLKNSDGDCSSIVGYIIATAWGDKYTKGISSQRKWHYAQASIWTYLGNFAPNEYKEYNEKGASSAWKNNTTVRNIILDAFAQYRAAHDVINSHEVNNINFSVTVSNPEFRYVPQGDGCDAGSYTTPPITITNNESKTISISITIPHESISICKYNNPTDCTSSQNGGTLETTLSAGESLQVFMSTKINLNSKVNFTVYASYEEEGTTKITTYDSERYGKSGVQAVIIQKKGSATSEVKKVYNDDRSIEFSQATLTHYTCPEKENNYESTNISSSNEETNPISKICANNATIGRNEEANPKEYTVYFSDCNCMTLNLSDGNSVRILLYETAGFRFGNLNPKEVYPGGSFKFFESSDGDGITTAYENKIKWEYADYYGTTPYYYNKNNPLKKNAEDIVSEIERNLAGKLKDEMNLKFKTLNSNKATKKEDINDGTDKIVQLPLKINIKDNIVYNQSEQTFEISLNNIKLPQAYLSSDREVKYENVDVIEEKYKIDGGNKYYVPIHYKSEYFPFNITTTNLSVLYNGNFWYNANCDIDITPENYLYGINGIRYRSITTSNPFPKATKKEDLPYNWQDWYWNNSTNISRIKNTYQPYYNDPSQPLYKISINNNKLKEIKNITTLYDNWDNINKEGISSFVTNNFEKYPTSNTSYCQSGRFSSDCDK